MDHPQSIQLFPTLRCNQDCGFCFNRAISNSFSYGEMNVREARLLREILTKAGVREIDILGGEPMLVPWLKDFVEGVCETGVTVNISTNGSLPQEAVRISNLPTDFVNLGFSLHGFAETHKALTGTDNFLKVVSGIRKTVGAGRNPIVKSTLLRGNADEIFGLVEYLKDIGVKRYFLLHEDLIGRPKTAAAFSFPEYREYYLALKRNFDGAVEIGSVAASGFYGYGAHASGRCDAGLNKIAVMPDGSVFPCNLFAGFREFRLGNIFVDGIEKIWRNSILDYFRRYSGGNRCESHGCPYHSGCTGGCPAHSYYFDRTLDSVDTRCLKR